MKGRAGETLCLFFPSFEKAVAPKLQMGSPVGAKPGCCRAPLCVPPAQAGVAAGWAREQAPAWWILAKFNSGCIPRVRSGLCDDTRAELSTRAWVWVRRV